MLGHSPTGLEGSLQQPFYAVFDHCIQAMRTLCDPKPSTPTPGVWAPGQLGRLNALLPPCTAALGQGTSEATGVSGPRLQDNQGEAQGGSSAGEPAKGADGHGS